MKNLILFFLFLVCGSRLLGQSTVCFDIVVTDRTAITGYSSATPIFANPGINSILSSYTITTFQQAYSGARMPYLQDVYRVVCNSLSLASDLHAANPSLFPFWESRKEIPDLAGIYTPNDWNLAISGGSDYIDYVNGRKAWYITKGDPSVVVGVVDNYINESHPDFYNIGGGAKLAYVGYNPLPTDALHHGTAVSSIIGAATDNGFGFPGIGFNCRLDFAGFYYGVESDMLVMASKGRRIINCSWTTGNTSTLLLRDQFYGQGVYNELYENGALIVAAAANGKYNSMPNTNFSFPASYDHVFSVTSIGWKYPVGTPSVSSNFAGLHDLKPSDLTETHNHNSRVDICAPTSVGAARWNPSDPTELFYDYAGGTSSSAPIVAGTAALVQSAMKGTFGKDANYSPYQLEWILKTSANPDILSLSDNLKYAGLLGAGRVDAEKAVYHAAGKPDLEPGPDIFALDPNDPATQTMYIKGIEINTICATGYSSNGVRPKLSPIIVNGTPPYRYVWEEVPDGSNTAILDDLNIAEPTVVGFLTSPTTPSYKLIYYRLTVYDNSSIPKVAMKTFKIPLKTSGFDLAMRDSYMDMMDEPNKQRINDSRDWDTWTSPDIWNRQAADGGTEHQQPEYFVTNPNYMYVRVRNVGCQPNPSNNKLRLYWSKASTGENWDTDWKYVNVPGIGGMKPGGREVTTSPGISIPVLQPGESQLLYQPWFPVNPEEYEGAPKEVEVCFLGRIEAPTADYGMTIPELINRGVGDNVRNNNNIVTRNTILTNLRPGDARTFKSSLLVANGTSTNRIFDFEFTSERAVFRHFAGDFSHLGSVRLYLGDLYDVWVNSGAHGSVADQDPQAKTVTFDGANPLRLEGIPMSAGDRFTVFVEFVLDSPLVVNEVSRHVFHARQWDASSSEDIFGAVNYEVTVSPAQSLAREAKEGISTGGVTTHYTLSPNPTSGVIKIFRSGGTQKVTADVSVTDVAGKQLLGERFEFGQGEFREFDLKSLPAGVYFVHIREGKSEVEVHKVVKE